MPPRTNTAASELFIVDNRGLEGTGSSERCSQISSVSQELASGRKKIQP
jgi:hypothetical protein